MEVSQLDILYEKYGFKTIRTKTEGIRVYALRTGYFLNADIVKLSNDVDLNSVKRDLEELGYACTTRSYSTLAQAENELFDGFFATEGHRKRLISEYKKFVDSNSKTLLRQYEYITAPYTSSETAKDSRISIIDHINNVVSSNGPVLIILEAAAGYGKTCTSFEVLNNFLQKDSKRIPIMTEFSLNRQAKIFKYVLLDEIDRNFSNLNSDLVKEQIVSGKTPLILDGFDELISKGSALSTSFEDVEPMLETIGELLSENAKIILTTRRTAIFSDYDFISWQEKKGKEFQTVRIKLESPSIEDWLGLEKSAEIEKNAPEIIPLLNPVLLSYLRGLKIEDIRGFCVEPSKISQMYFDSLLERERERQDLLISVNDQTEIFHRLTVDMVNEGFLTEEKEYVQLRIADKAIEILEQARDLYKNNNRPTIEELSAKLVNHALLDRALKDDSLVGYVNDFVLGKLIGDIITQNKVEISSVKNADSVLDFAINAYQIESHQQRQNLWEKCFELIKKLDSARQFLYESQLLRKISHGYENTVITSNSFKKTQICSPVELSGFTFIDCEFNSCEIDFSCISNSVFISCKFLKCSYKNIENGNGIMFTDCDGDEGYHLSNFNGFYGKIESEQEVLEDRELEILKFFIPNQQRDVVIKTRNIHEIYRIESKNNRKLIIVSIEKLRKMQIIGLKNDSVIFLEADKDRILEMKALIYK